MVLIQLNFRIAAIARELEHDQFMGKTRRVRLEDELSKLLKQRKNYHDTIGESEWKRELSKRKTSQNS